MPAVPAAMLVPHQIVVPPAHLRPDIDLLGFPITPDCRVRVFGGALVTDETKVFGFDLDGDRAEYVEGTVITLGEVVQDGVRCYEVLADALIDGGQRQTHRQVYYPPVNGTPTNADRFTCGVLRIVKPVRRDRSVSSAVMQMRDRIAERLYWVGDKATGTDQDRAALRLHLDLEAAFGFGEDSGIPASVRAKAFAIARRMSFERLGRYVPAGILEDYAELADILVMGQTNPIHIEPR